MKKCLVLGFIILFVGASVLPSISGNIRNLDNVQDLYDEIETIYGNIQSSYMTSNGGDILPSISKVLKVDSEPKSDAPNYVDNPMFDVYDIHEFEQTAWGATSADFNDDGAVDFAVSSATAPFTQSTISIFYNDGNLEFTQDDVFTFSYSYIMDLDSGDYDLDGDIDLMFTYSESKGSGKTNGTVNLLLNDGENNFEDYIMVAKHVGNKRYNPQLTSADFDMDGDLDFLVGDNSGQVEFYLNDGNGNFTSNGIIHDWGIVSWGVTSADYDNDGDIDFLVAADLYQGAYKGSIYLIRNQMIESNYSIVFEPGPGEIIEDDLLEWQEFTASLTSLDYNNDGDMDFIAGIGACPYLYMNKQGVYDPFFICRNSAPYEFNHLREGALSSADFNDDGYTDFVAGGVSGYVRLFINKRCHAVITRPLDGLGIYYLYDKINYLPIPFNNVLIIGKFTVVVKELEEVEKVEFYVDRWLQETVTAPPYNFSWTWKPILLFRIRHTIKIVAYDSDGNQSSEDEKKVWRIL